MEEVSHDRPHTHTHKQTRSWFSLCFTLLGSNHPLSPPFFYEGLHVVGPNDLLGDVLRELKQGRSHMALVRDIIDEQYYEIQGILTLEDILEVS